jgi:GrpB-like predicted nucleotidyltransferase (UPF0157 family)
MPKKRSISPGDRTRGRASTDPVRIMPHDPKWSAAYEETKRGILKALKTARLDKIVMGVEHICSTAIPGLGAKPCIDVMIGLRSIEDLASFPANVLTRIAFVRLPFSNSTVAKYRQFFTKRGQPAVNVHVFAYRRALWRGHLALRDYLRVHPETARRYEHLKKLLATKWEALGPLCD